MDNMKNFMRIYLAFIVVFAWTGDVIGAAAVQDPSFLPTEIEKEIEVLRGEETTLQKVADEDREKYDHNKKRCFRVDGKVFLAQDALNKVRGKIRVREEEVIAYYQLQEAKRQEHVEQMQFDKWQSEQNIKKMNEMMRGAVQPQVREDAPDKIAKLEQGIKILVGINVALVGVIACSAWALKNKSPVLA
jgi:hypothetical protein